MQIKRKSPSAGVGSQSGGDIDIERLKNVSEEDKQHLRNMIKSHNPWRLLWGEIGEYEGSADVYERLQTVWDTVLALGGLIAGFSYVVLSSDVDFPKEGLVGKELRPYFYGFFSVLTFVMSLGSALLTVILQNTLKMAGEETAGWFAGKHEQLVGAPEAFVGTSIGCMLFAGLIAIDGLFPPFVFYFATVFGFGTFMALGAVWWVVSNGLKSQAAAIMLEKIEGAKTQ